MVKDIFPMRGPTCGAQMSMISFIEEPKIIDRIIRHLELTFEAERARSGRAAPVSSAGISYGSRGEWGVFLRAFLVVLCVLEGRVYIELDGLGISGNLCRFLSH